MKLHLLIIFSLFFYILFTLLQSFTNYAHFTDSCSFIVKGWFSCYYICKVFIYLHCVERMKIFKVIPSVQKIIHIMQFLLLTNLIIGVYASSTLIIGVDFELGCYQTIPKNNNLFYVQFAFDFVFSTIMGVLFLYMLNKSLNIESNKAEINKNVVRRFQIYTGSTILLSVIDIIVMISGVAFATGDFGVFGTCILIQIVIFMQCLLLLLIDKDWNFILTMTNYESESSLLASSDKKKSETLKL